MTIAINITSSDQFKINLLFFVQLALTYASHFIPEDFNRLGRRCGSFLLQRLLPEFAYPFLLNCEISIIIPSKLQLPNMKNNWGLDKISYQITFLGSLYITFNIALSWNYILGEQCSLCKVILKIQPSTAWHQRNIRTLIWYKMKQYRACCTADGRKASKHDIAELLHSNWEGSLKTVVCDCLKIVWNSALSRGLTLQTLPRSSDLGTRSILLAYQTSKELWVVVMCFSWFHHLWQLSFTKWLWKLTVCLRTSRQTSSDIKGLTFVKGCADFLWLMLHLGL